jgi:hypothetical protein
MVAEFSHIMEASNIYRLGLGNPIGFLRSVGDHKSGLCLIMHENTRFTLTLVLSLIIMISGIVTAISSKISHRTGILKIEAV